MLEGMKGRFLAYIKTFDNDSQNFGLLVQNSVPLVWEDPFRTMGGGGTVGST